MSTEKAQPGRCPCTQVVKWAAGDGTEQWACARCRRVFHREGDPTPPRQPIMVAMVRARKAHLDEHDPGTTEAVRIYQSEEILRVWCGYFIVWRNNPTVGQPQVPTCPGNPAMPHRCPVCPMRKAYDDPRLGEYEPSVTA